jgi:hypothetical protein
MVNVILGFLFTVGLPAIMPGGLSLQGFIVVYPDVGYALVTSGVVAFLWILRTVLAYFALRGGEQSGLPLTGKRVKPALAQK